MVRAVHPVRLSAHRQLFALAALIGTLFLVPASSSLAGAPASPRAGAPKAEPTPAERMASAWTLYYKGQYKEAIGVAERVGSMAGEPLAFEAAHCQARCFWAQGNLPGRAKAQQLWAAIEKAAKTGRVKQRSQIARALQLSAEADPAKKKQAIDLLQDVLRSGASGTLVAEAAVDLTNLYGDTKQFKEAQQTLEFCKKYFEKSNFTRLEITPQTIAPFLAAADAAAKRLVYLQDDGRQEFEKAEALRHAHKYAEALACYQAIAKAYPQTDYAPQSELAMGSCLLGMERPLQAVEHWKRFVSTAPAGAWRGQAYVGLIDVFLEHLLEVKDAAKYAEMAAAAKDKALADEKAGESWKALGYDLSLRQGIVAFLQGKADVAAKAFEEAKTYAGGRGKPAAEGLDGLIEAAKANKGVVPDDVAVRNASRALNAGDKPTVALSMAMIYKVTGRQELSDKFLSRVLKDRFLKPTPAQVAFALYGEALSHFSADINKAPEVKEQLVRAIKVCPEASFHDESLYLIATLITQTAHARAKTAEYAAQHAAPARPLTPEEREAKEKADNQRRAALVKEEAEALPYWRELLKKYPKSCRSEVALYRLGVIEYVQGDVAEDARAGPIFAHAIETLKQFTDTCPDSPWAGDAYIKQIDVALERLFQIQRAQTTMKLATQWMSDCEKRTARWQEKRSTLRPWQTNSPLPSKAMAKYLVDELRLRAILLAYLAERYENAKELLVAAGPVAPINGKIDPSKMEKIGLFFLQKAILDKKPVWKPEGLAAAQTDPQRTALKLADLYLKVMRHAKAAAIYQRIVDHDSAFAPVGSGLEVYACIQAARCYTFKHAQHDKALTVLQRLYRSELVQEPMAADGLLWLATLTYNFTQDPKKARPHFEYILKNFSGSPVAERTLYFYCLNALAAKDKVLAEAAGREFLTRYPQSAWAKHVTVLLNNDIAHLPLQERGKP